MSASRDLTPEEMDLAVDYVSGDLGQYEQMRFEQRMAADPQLALEVEGLLSSDLLLEAAAGSGQLQGVRESGTSRGWRAWSLPLAAAFLALLGLRLLVPEFFSGGADASVPRVALLPGSATPEEFLTRHESLHGLSPPWLDRPRGGAADSNVSAREFVQRAEVVDRDSMVAAAEASATPPTAGRFFVPIESQAPFAALVLAIPAAGPALRLYPPPAAPGEPSIPTELLPAGWVVLPAARFSVRTDAMGEARVDHHRGWLLPLGAGALEVLVGTRASWPSADELRAFDDLLAGTDPLAPLAARLAEAGFVLSRHRVLEP